MIGDALVLLAMTAAVAVAGLAIGLVVGRRVDRTMTAMDARAGDDGDDGDDARAAGPPVPAGPASGMPRLDEEAR